MTARSPLLLALPANAVLLFTLLLPCAPAPAQQTAPTLTPGEKSIVARLKGLRGLPDDQRAAATQQLATDIRNLPPDASKVRLANGLANLSTEGDFGHDTLQQVATTLADALRRQPAQSAEPYLELAALIRYEHVTASLDDAQMTAAMAKLEGQDNDRRLADFTLTGLGGKSWTLHDLKGHVVLVNFWATWCPPCRKEMPDLDALYARFKDQGLIVLAISDEDASKVKPFIAEHHISYPVLLDPGGKVNERFHIDGIPKSFVYDRAGRLVAQSIDMRTRAQFLAMLQHAGLNTQP